MFINNNESKLINIIMDERNILNKIIIGKMCCFSFSTINCREFSTFRREVFYGIRESTSFNTKTSVGVAGKGRLLLQINEIIPIKRKGSRTYKFYFWLTGQLRLKPKP